MAGLRLTQESTIATVIAKDSLSTMFRMLANMGMSLGLICTSIKQQAMVV